MRAVRLHPRQRRLASVTGAALALFTRYYCRRSRQRRVDADLAKIRHCCMPAAPYRGPAIKPERRALEHTARLVLRSGEKAEETTKGPARDSAFQNGAKVAVRKTLPCWKRSPGWSKLAPLNFDDLPGPRLENAKPLISAANKLWKRQKIRTGDQNGTSQGGEIGSTGDWMP